MIIPINQKKNNKIKKQTNEFNQPGAEAPFP